MADDVVLNKAATIERCLQRVLAEYAGDMQNLIANQTKQDAIVLNLQRACETTIDLAMYVVSQRKLGVPQDSRDAFTLLTGRWHSPSRSGDANATNGGLPQHPPESGCHPIHHC